MKVLLSIKPEYANKIFDGSKKFEFRKSIFKSKVTTVVVYASSPVQQVIGEFDIEQIISDTPQILWEHTKEHSGITSDFFFKYFEDRQIAHAIKIKSTRKYLEPLCLKKDFKATPPQSYTYLQ